MKQLLMALVLVGGAAVPALADGNGGPQVPNSAFLVWQQQGGQRMAFTPLPDLNQQARKNVPAEVAGAVPQTRVN